MFFKNKDIVFFLVALLFYINPLHAQLDETCLVTVNGQTVKVGIGGEYSINNIPAGANLVRLHTVCSDSAQTRYGRSGFFQIINNQDFFISELDLVWRTTAFASTSKLLAVPAAPTLTQISQTTQINVTAFRSDSTQQDVTPRAFGSTYTSSNTTIITVDQDGLVTATGEGIGFVTVTNEGATSVARINVSFGDPLTAVEGFVQDENGSFFEGAEVTVNVGGVDSTDVTGHFSIPGVATTLGLLSVTATADTGGAMLFGRSDPLTPVPAGLTDAGIITISNDVFWVDGDGFWHIPGNWSSNAVPGPGSNVIIDIPDSVVTVTLNQGNHSIFRLRSEEEFVLSGSGALSVDSTVKVNNEFTLLGGTLSQATVLPGSSGEGLIATTSGGTLDSVTIDGFLTLPNGTNVTVTNGLTLNGTISYTTTNIATSLLFPGTQTLDGSGEIVLSGLVDFLAQLKSANPGETLTIGSGITIHGGSGTVGAANNTFINQGLISSDQSGKQLVLKGIDWQNAGTMEAINGGVLSLQGSLSTEHIGTFNSSNGNIQLVGFLDNAGQTLSFDATTGSWSLLGGFINGGIIAGSGGEGLIATTSGGILDSVTIDGFLTLPNRTNVTVTNGLTLNGTISYGTTNVATSLLFSGTQTLDGSGEIVLSGLAEFLAQLKSANPGEILTIGSGITIHGGSGTVGAANATFINQGLISSDQSGKELSLEGTDWQNAGTIEAINGGVLSLQGSLSTGHIGTFMGSNGTIQLVGFLDNAGQTLSFDATTGSWSLVGGFINGGIIAGAGGEGLIATTSGGTLDSVTIDGFLTLPNASDVTVTNGMTLNGTVSFASTGQSVNLLFSGTQTLDGSGEIVFAAPTPSFEEQVKAANPGETLTIGSSITIHGGSGTVGAANNTFINQGLISSDQSGKQLSLEGTDWQNAGTIEAINGATVSAQGSWSSSGTISIGSSSLFTSVDYTQTAGITTLSGGTLTATNIIDIQAGDLSGFGSINGDVVMAGQLNPGSPTGILNIAGDYTQSSFGALNIEIGGLTAGTDFDQLNITGTANLDGTLNLNLINAFTPTLGQTFVIMTFASSNGNFSTINGTLIGGGLEFQVDVNATNVTLVVVQQ